MRLILALTILALTACSSQKEIATEPAVQNTEEAKKVRVEPDFERTTDAFTIYDAHIEGRRLHLSVSYSGGCKDHVFELFTDGFIMKSLPPKQRFYLRHYAHKDACEALVEQDLVFDLDGLVSAGNSLVILLDGYKADLRVDY